MRLEFLRHLHGSTNACASVYTSTSRTGETAAEEVGLRWRAARETLAGEGADEATLDALAELVTDPGSEAPGLAAFARSGRVEFAWPMPAAPLRPIARYAPLPHLMPLLAQAPPQSPYLRVTANRSGGELMEVMGPDHADPVRVEGEGWPVHKPPGGGWSHARFQRSAEEAWARNEKEFAAAVTAAAERLGAGLIVLAGDARARALLLDHLGQLLHEKVVTVDKEVPADSDALAEAAAEAFRQRAGQASREGLESFRTQLPRGRAAEGLADVVAALREGKVSDLFLADDPSSTAVLWFGRDVTQTAVTAGEARDRGAEETLRDRADAVLVRDMVLTGAELHFIPDDEPRPRDGIAALLRYA